MKKINMKPWRAGLNDDTNHSLFLSRFKAKRYIEALGKDGVIYKSVQGKLPCKELKYGSWIISGQESYVNGKWKKGINEKQ